VRTLPGFTGSPRSALATAAKHSARLARLFRALLVGSRFSGDCPMQLCHCAVKFVRKPLALELRPGNALACQGLMNRILSVSSTVSPAAKTNIDRCIVLCYAMHTSGAGASIFGISEEAVSD
jgi:hypothetical protein